MVPKIQLQLLIAVQLILIIATSISQPYWPLILKQLTPSNIITYPLWNTLIYASPLFCAAFSASFWGHMADKFGYKKILLRASLGLLVTQILIVFAHSPSQLFGCRVFQGLFAGSIAASQALGVKLLPTTQHATIIAKLQSSVSIGMIIGPVIGGYVFNAMHYTIIFYIAIILCSFSTFIIYKFISEPNNQSLLINENKNSITGRQSLLMPLSIGLAQMARYLLIPIFALYVTITLHQQTHAIGMLYMASSSAFFIASPMLAPLFNTLMEKKKEFGSLIPILGIISAAILSITLIDLHTYLEVFINRALWGICLAAITPLLYALMLKGHTKDQGKIIGTACCANKAGALLGILIGNLVFYHYTIDLLFIVTGAIYLITAGLLIFDQLLHYQNLRLTRTTHN